MSELTISTPRLTLRPVCENDAADIFAYSSDPAVLRYTTADTPKSLSDTEAFVASILQAEPNDLYWAVCIRPSVHCVGIVDFAYDKTEGSIHYGFAKTVWGKGYATEAVAAVIAWARSYVPSLATIETTVFSANYASQRVLEKNGFELVGEKTTTKGGEIVPECVYRLVMNSLPR